MKNDLEKLQVQAGREISKAQSLAELEQTELKYFSRKEGLLNNILKGLKDLTAEQKKIIGGIANEIKHDLEKAIASRRKELEQQEINKRLEEEWIDTSRPVLLQDRKELGSLHPLFQIQYELEDIFKSLGFMVLDGPELESDYFNFEALNVPKFHPARDMQDTFYIKDEDDLLLRTQTSSVQVRAMLEFGVPIKAIVPGKTFRYEDSDVSHDAQFHQLEGLMVDKNISIADLIGVMRVLLKGIFKKDVKIRLRQGFFPFVEPGFELDINCLICGGHGCSVCKQTGWLELMPCGMVHPKVLESGKVDPAEYSGFAFGLGLTRLVMMKYGIDDIRLLSSGDLRFLRQF